MIKTLVKIYATFWLVLLVVGAFISLEFLISSQVAFFSTVLILITSFYAYKRRVEIKLANEKDEILARERELDESEYDEWGLDSTVVQTNTDTTQESQIFIKNEIKTSKMSNINKARINLKDEKERLKRRKYKLKEINLTTAFMPYRLLAYGVFVFCFLVLKRRDMLDIVGFLMGLSTMPIGIFVFAFFNRQDKI
ncbi:hypothetical protein KDE12_03770 [Campylobacter sp. faydin G-105]|uniref:hypothetical protein n=1 Tax=Campylobacter anatolicus TaxID=2829105 RepID=UPI001BA12107|nr:hypothetical protein [Campylobacter anatolicus]MBR8461970.1 hypothetical protein [Campylobacter anatolicus]